MTRRRSGEGSIYPVKDSHDRVTGYRGYVWCSRPDGERYRKYVKGKTYDATGGHGSNSGTGQAADRLAPTYQSLETSSRTGLKRLSSRTWHPRHTRRMSCSFVCTSFLT